MMTKQIIVSGYPEKEFYFTGEYHYSQAGYRRKLKNRNPFRAPIYKAENGEQIIDMSQVEYLAKEKE